MSTILERNVSISSLLPAVILHGLQTEDEEKCLDEAAMCAVATLIVNTALGAIKALAKGHYKSFDANPGNAGCQSLAVELRRLSNLGLQDECMSLRATVLRIKELVNRRKGDAKDPLSLPHLFFQKEFGDVFVSKAMEYLLHCYLSAVLRTPYQKLDSGIVMTRSESSKLSMLSSKITLLDGALRRKIVEENQRTLTRLSVHAAHEMASRLTSLELKEKELVVTMLSAENTHVFTPDPQYEPKSFGCLFYEVKTALTHLQEEQAIVCLESIVREGEIFHMFLQPRTAGAEFEVLSDEACSRLPGDTKIVVVNAIVHVAKEKAAEIFMTHGFSTTILAQAAIEPPYEPKSQLADVRVPEAVREIMKYQEKDKQIGSFMTIDHIYFNTLAAELKK